MRSDAASLVLGLLVATPAAAQPRETPANRSIVDAVRRLTAPLVQKTEHFRYVVRLRAPATENKQPIEVVVDRFDGAAFTVAVRSRWATVSIHHDAERTALVLPKHRVAFVGEGPRGEGPGSLAPRGFLDRLLGRGNLLPGLARSKALYHARRAVPVTDGDGWRIDDELSAALGQNGELAVTTTAGRGFVDGLTRLEVSLTEPPAEPTLSLDELRVTRLARSQIENLAFRALRRFLEIQLPRYLRTSPIRAKKVPNGELRRVDGQWVALLRGTPEEIGRAHGRLLGRQSVTTLNSCLYLVGFVETVRSGRWFPRVLEGAWRRLSPHIPDRHKREMVALARAIPDVTEREMMLGNVFPEYFHCSGFALFGDATKDGTLYHGRVLDYMTAIGLQQVAVTFVVQPSEGHAFLNVGYAGFLGCVTGMNDQQISLGEMGGGGRGEWDGVPMATLMRRALEECSTLEQVCALWKNSPRTCEYYYVFADGKIPDARGVAATPGTIEFVRPGEDHAKLGTGFEDAIVLSAGRRLELLRRRIQSGYGKFDVRTAIQLMTRPVALGSNLHNALLVPQQGIAYVANATDRAPAASQPYAKIDFRALLAELAGTGHTTAPTGAKGAER